VLVTGTTLYSSTIIYLLTFKDKVSLVSCLIVHEGFGGSFSLTVFKISRELFGWHHDYIG
jgi:hypothetical protein